MYWKTISKCTLPGDMRKIHVFFRCTNNVWGYINSDYQNILEKLLILLKQPISVLKNIIQIINSFLTNVLLKLPKCYENYIIIDST